MSTSVGQLQYVAHGLAWLLREKPAAYRRGASDNLFWALKTGAAQLSCQVLELTDLKRPLSTMQEQKLVFALEALLEIRHELLREQKIL
jgi:hypothetical protein